MRKNKLEEEFFEEFFPGLRNLKKLSKAQLNVKLKKSKEKMKKAAREALKALEEFKVLKNKKKGGEN